jgi:hypothetical protein
MWRRACMRVDAMTLGIVERVPAVRIVSLTHASSEGDSAIGRAGHRLSLFRNSVRGLAHNHRVAWRSEPGRNWLCRASLGQRSLVTERGSLIVGDRSAARSVGIGNVRSE